jgi:hypothetical protein
VARDRIADAGPNARQAAILVNRGQTTGHAVF